MNTKLITAALILSVLFGVANKIYAYSPPSCSTPSTPSPASPNDSSTCQSISGVLLDWSDVSCDRYYIYMSTTSTEPNANDLVGNTTSSQWDTNNWSVLDPNTVYYWSVRARNYIGCSGPKYSGFSTPWDFKTEPGQASNPDPYDTETEVDIDTDLSWTAGAGTQNVNGHHVYFGTNNPPTNIENGTVQSSTTYSPVGNLDCDTIYYWRIDEEDVNGCTRTGNTWQFTTGTSPDKATNPNPNHTETEVDIDTDLSWTAGAGTQDVDGHHVYFGTDNPPTNIENGTVQSSTTYSPVGNLDCDTIYYWRIDEENANGCIRTGDTWQFTTSEMCYVNNTTQETWYNIIQNALDDANDGDVIVVHPDTYYETIDFNGVSCTLTSNDPNDPAVIGATIIDGNDANSVVTFDSGEDANAVLTGFTITNGNATYGGGIYDSNSSPTITRCLIIDNDADYGGGMYNTTSSSPTVKNCIFAENIADVNGGAIYDSNCSPTISNCTFSDNSADADGGGMYNYGPSSTPKVTNCILWGNEAVGVGDEVCNKASADPNFSYCDIRNSFEPIWDSNFGANGGGNIDSDPCFVYPSDVRGPDGIFGTNDDGLRIHADSNCVDAADGDAAPLTDIAGLGRIDISGVANTGTGDPNYTDIGAYESPLMWFVDVDATGNDDGTSWTDAYNDLQDALTAAISGDEIWVAEGTYYPTDGNDRSVFFELVSGVGLYGGFDATETARNQRDWENNVTTLSGDINVPNDQNDNSYTIVFADYVDLDTSIDGFTIKNGNATGNGSDSREYRGGGMYNNCSSLTITNCIFTQNDAHGGAGISNLGSSPLVTNCTFSENVGIAMLNDHVSFLYHLCDSPSIDNPTPKNEFLTNSPTLINCTFIRNSSGGGAAIYIYQLYPSLTTLIDCVFIGNKATNPSAGGGGAIVIGWAGELSLTNCIFIGNSSMAHGGALFLWGGGETIATLTNCTFTGNCSQQSGAIASWTDDMKLTNCILWNDHANYGSNDEILCSYPNDVTYSDVMGGWPGTGNIDSDPCFVNAFDFSDFTIAAGTTTTIAIEDASIYQVNDVIEYDNDAVVRTVTDVNTTTDIITFANDALDANSVRYAVIFNWGVGATDLDEDLALNSGSPCIDAGDGDEAPELDITGEIRIDDPSITNTGTGDPNYTDIGAYEYDPNE